MNCQTTARAARGIGGGLVAALIVLLPGLINPPRADAVACPGTGAKLTIKVNNPTASTIANVTLSGQTAANYTCTNQSFSYSQTVSLNPGDNTFTIPGSGGLNSGMWVHRINVSSTGQDQYQQGVVLYATAAADYPTVKWTYFPNVVTANVAGDTPSGACPSSCTFRQALTRANGLAGAGTATSPVLIQFTASPGAMTSSTTLTLGSTTIGYITVDGTDSNGDPWIVGDPLAAAKGSQDAFPRVLDLAGLTKLDVRGANVTIKGLAIDDTTSGTPSGNVVEGNAANLTLDSVRLRGGARTLASCGAGCGSEVLLYSNQSGIKVVNSEAQAAYGRAIELPASGATDHQITDSWVHHNYYAEAVKVNKTTLQRNTIELTGFRVSDNAQVNGTASGLVSSGADKLTLLRNVLRNNTGWGADISTTSLGFDVTGDYLCGNDQGGARVNGTGAAGKMAGDGLTAAYNGGHGISLDSTLATGPLTFANSAFTANVSCGFKNSSALTASANGNQWRGVGTGSCTGSVDYCTGSPITCSSSQDAANAPISLDADNPAAGTTPVTPSNVIQVGQTVRLQGNGFNAIAGNPLASGVCTQGAGNLATDNCCRKASKSNTCDAVSPPNPVNGDCVAFKDRTGAWNKADVAAVTPRTVAAEVPVTLLACLGGSSEQVRVAKLNSSGVTLAALDSYCTSKAAK